MNPQYQRITLIITAICVAVYFAWWLVPAQSVFNLLSFPQSAAQFQDYWRWITPIFMHFSLLHIAFNLMWWWYLGTMIEHYHSSVFLLVLLLLTALTSNLTQYFTSGANFGGLSGVVYGLLGYIAVFKKLYPRAAITLPPGILGFMLVWLVLGFTPLITWLIGPIANGAHLGGLIAGCLVGLVRGLMLKPRLL